MMPLALLDDALSPIFDHIAAIVIGGLAFGMIVRNAWSRSIRWSNVALLRVCAGCLAVGTVVVPILIHRFEQALLDRFTPRLPGQTEFFSIVRPETDLPGFGAFALVVVVVALAQVWQRANHLQRDVEATV